MSDAKLSHDDLRLEIEMIVGDLISAVYLGQVGGRTPPSPCEVTEQILQLVERTRRP